MMVGVGNGLAIGLTMALVAQFWFRRPMLGLVIGVALMINLFVAASVGAVIPLLLRRLKADPALASGIFVIMFTDVCGFLSFLGLATLLMKWMH
jgi:magnesium transporter